MTKKNKRAWLAIWFQKRRRKRKLLPAPVSLSLSVDPTDFFLTWNDASNNADGFRIYRTAFDDPAVLIAELEANEYEYQDNAVEMGVTYTYYVVAFNAVGESDRSNSVFGELTPAE